MSERDSVTVAIVGAGEMGAAVGRRLREAGARVTASLAGRSAGKRRAGSRCRPRSSQRRRFAGSRRERRPVDRSAGGRGRSRRTTTRSARACASQASLRRMQRDLARDLPRNPRPARWHRLHRRRHYRRTARRRHSRSRQGSALLRLWRRRASADASGGFRPRHFDS